MEKKFTEKQVEDFKEAFHVFDKGKVILIINHYQSPVIK